MSETIETQVGPIDRGRAEALAAFLNLDADESLADGLLPPLWQFLFLLPHPRPGELGTDGHRTTGTPRPPGPGFTRMFAGGRATHHIPVRIGEPARRTTSLLDTTERVGRSGPLIFTTVLTTIEQDGCICISEEQDIVYRRAADRLPGTAERIGPGVADRVANLDEAFRPDPVSLFRFSALTENAHRIHYDRDFARGEGYPGLVVHGPLQALLLGERMRRNGADFAGRVYRYRLIAPAFEHHVLSYSDGVDGSLELVNQHADQTAVATLT